VLHIGSGPHNLGLPRPDRRLTSRRRLALLLAAALALLSAGRAGAQGRDVILATTTSLQDSGLLDSLTPLFERRCGCRLKVIAAGSGQSLALGARGEADVVLAHAPALERRYVAAGALVERRLVMTNDFVLVGPPGDPARIRSAAGVADAFRRIAARRAAFASRGDSSGTHLLERELWRRAGVSPAGAWYLQVGQGMGATLRIASQKRAYTLTDRGTYLAQRHGLALAILFQGAPELLNVYHVLLPNPVRFPRLNRDGGRGFADFMVSPAAQALIGRFGAARLGEPLFHPAAGQVEPAAPARRRRRPARR